MRVKAGDLFEFCLNDIVANMLLTHTDPQYGGLLYEVVRKDDGGVDVLQGVEYPCAWFPIAAGIKKGVLKKLGSVNVPEPLRVRPNFRSCHYDKSGNPVSWFLFDGSEFIKIDAVDEKFARLPLLLILNDTALSDQIINGWKMNKFP